MEKRGVAFSCELTTKCQILCDMCMRTTYTQKENKNGGFHVGDIEEVVLDRILEEMERFHKAGYPVTFAPMGLGEPVLYKKIYSTFEKIKKISEKIRIVMVVNGVKLDREDCENLARYTDEVSVSLNANNANLYKEHMGVDKYDVVCQNIRTLIETRNKSDRDKPDIFIQYLDWDNTGVKGFNLDAKEWLKIMRNGDKCYVHPIVNEGGNFGGSNFSVNKEPYPCDQPSFRMSVKVNGDVYPCDACYFSGQGKVDSLYFGNIKTMNLFDFFRDKESKAADIISRMRKNDYSGLPACSKCNNYRLGVNTYFKLPFLQKASGYKWF